MKKRPFVPFELPMIDFLDMQQLMTPLVEAYRKIAIYNEKLKSTKVNHTNLLELFSLKEAVESTKIEGTQITMDEMLNYRATENKAMILSIMVDTFFSRTYDPRLPLKENRSISVS